MSSSHHLVGHFNAHLETAIVVFADEAFWAGDKQGEGTLKTLITSDTIRVERKGIDSKSARSHVYLIMASNSDWVVPASGDERRYLVLDVSSKRRQDHEYFAALEREWQAGGREAFMHYLLHLDLSSFNVRKVPQSM
jgi:phage/plasmid-associated DNA primase